MHTAKIMVLPYDKAGKSAFEDIRQEMDAAPGALGIRIAQLYHH